MSKAAQGSILAKAGARMRTIHLFGHSSGVSVAESDEIVEISYFAPGYCISHHPITGEIRILVIAGLDKSLYAACDGVADRICTPHDPTKILQAPPHIAAYSHESRGSTEYLCEAEL